jgi:DNA-binding NarL/FixJ family response regulator
MTERVAPAQAAPDEALSAGSGRENRRRLTVMLVDSRAWTREALAHALEKADRLLEVRPVPSTAALAATERPPGAAVILVSVSGVAADDHGLLDCIVATRAAMPGVPVVALSEHAEAQDILLAIGRGLSGYVLATVEGRHLALALRFVADGGIFVPAEPLLQGLEPGAAAPAADAARIVAKPPSTSLTPRETAVLRLLREGLSNKQIARALDLREPTVKVHVHNVLLKLGATNRTQLALLAGQMMPDEPDAG